MNFLIEWNEKINLTAITEPEEIILKHFVDSLTISKYIEKKSYKIFAIYRVIFGIIILSMLLIK